MNQKDLKLEKNPLQKALEKCKQAFVVTFLFSLFVNILQVITPLYTLQVLDRVIGSGSMETLLMLSLVIGLVHLVYTLLQIARSFTLIKIGEWLDNELSPLLFSYSVASSAIKRTSSTSQLLRDFQSLKTFLTSSGINTVFDAPWSIIYIIAVFSLNKYIGYLTVGASIVVVSIAILNAIATNKTLGESTEFSIQGMNQAEIASRNAEVVEAMGMMKNVSKNWHYFNKESLAKQSIASYRNGIISNISRFIRNIMQMGVTAIGAYMVVSSSGMEMTTGGMIMSSILVGRALAPFDNAIEMWKQISNANKSYARINNAFSQKSLRDDSMPIPNIEGKIKIENLFYTAAESLKTGEIPNYIVQDISLEIQPGEIVAIIGPSAAGKSTLAKLIVGVWLPSSGVVRLDGGDVYKWNRENFGQYVGYLPQGIELFSGTIKQNIARMEELEKIDPVKVVEAARMAGAHEMIMNMKNSYDTDIGISGSNLSGGQRQRVGLARAFYGDPKLVVLDEPNANLDEAGELALSNALKSAKEKNISLIVVSHRPSVLSFVDKILVLRNGKILSWGSKEQVLKDIQTSKGGTIHINN
jgi:PrtD family type I secretion system ABC transporter